MATRLRWPAIQATKADNSSGPRRRQSLVLAVTKSVTTPTRKVGTVVPECISGQVLTWNMFARTTWRDQTVSPTRAADSRGTNSTESSMSGSLCSKGTVHLVVLTARHAIPAIYQGRDFPDAGGILESILRARNLKILLQQYLP